MIDYIRIRSLERGDALRSPVIHSSFGLVTSKKDPSFPSAYVKIVGNCRTMAATHLHSQDLDNVLTETTELRVFLAIAKARYIRVVPSP